MPPRIELEIAMDGAADNRPLPNDLITPGVIGLVLAWYGSATLEQLRAVLQPSSGLACILLLAMLVTLVAGLQLPSLLRVAANKDTFCPGEAWAALRHDAGGLAGPADPLRLINSCCLVLAGAAIIALQPLARSVGAVYQAALASFHWTPVTLQGLEFLLATALVLLPLLCLGLALNCAQRLAGLHRRPAAGTAASLCTGLAIGLALAPTALGVFGPGVTLPAALILMVCAMHEVRPLGTHPQPCAAGMDSEGSWSQGGWLTSALWATGFLALLHILLWNHLEPTVGLSRASGWLVAALGLGLLVGAGPARCRAPGACSIRGIALGNAAAVSGSLILGGAILRLTELPAGAKITAGLMILLPTFGAGVLLARLLECAELQAVRPARAVVSGWTAVALGAAGAVLAAVAGLFNEPRPYGWLVLLGLAWLGLGLVVWIRDASLRPTSRRASGLAVAAVVAVLGWMLPRHQSAWRQLADNLESAGRGQLCVISRACRADELLAALESSSDGGFPRIEQATPDQMLRRLALLREPAAAVYFRFEDAARAALSPALLDSLAATAYSRLLPDGFLGLQVIDGSAAPGVVVSSWRQRVEGWSSSISCTAGPQGAVVLAFREAGGGPRNTSALLTAAAHHPQD